ncbi:MAG: D-alanyl-D-alanine carboxypeptidase/D-alanyl-D-alanine-endopeptidase, partial [Candidatus Aminicenantes bacterium]|nr:D-alanyl-D-alanine carboxypeptidase/D-alanyl-D-alanine-endopeptidase [Candidatus Aminicenantes bacterium]
MKTEQDHFRTIILSILIGYFILFYIQAPIRSHDGPHLGNTKKDLYKELYGCLNEFRFKNVDFGIKIETVDGKQTLFQHQPGKLFIPASVTKIITSGISLLKFGPGFRFETQLIIDGQIKSRILKGNLVMKGKGDPALMLGHLDLAVNSIKEKIDIIEGDLIYDISFLDSELPRFPPNARHLYAPPCALTVNYNWIVLGLQTGPPVKLWTIPKTSYARLQYRVDVSDSHSPGRPTMIYKKRSWGDQYHISGKITRWDRRYKVLRLCVTRPGLFTATLFRECCERAGIILKGNIKKGSSPPNSRILETIRTKPLKDIVSTLNQESNNVIAELINKNLGAFFDSIPGTREKGLNIIRTYLQEKLNFKKHDFCIIDASGLSLKNRLSASQLTQALNHFYLRMGEDFYQTLAWQGNHPHAMNPIPPSGIRMAVKSGTLPTTGVNTVAGYIFMDKSDVVLSFAIMANRRGSGARAYSGTFTIPVMSAIIKALNKNHLARISHRE